MKRKTKNGIKLIRYFCNIRPFIATPKSADLIKEKMRWHASNVWSRNSKKLARNTLARTLKRAKIHEAILFKWCNLECVYLYLFHIIFSIFSHRRFTVSECVYIFALILNFRSFSICISANSFETVIICYNLMLSIKRYLENWNFPVSFNANRGLLP